MQSFYNVSGLNLDFRQQKQRFLVLHTGNPHLRRAPKFILQDGTPSLRQCLLRSVYTIGFTMGSHVFEFVFVVRGCSLLQFESGTGFSVVAGAYGWSPTTIICYRGRYFWSLQILQTQRLSRLSIVHLCQSYYNFYSKFSTKFSTGAAFLTDLICFFFSLSLKKPINLSLSQCSQCGWSQTNTEFPGIFIKRFRRACAPVVDCTMSIWTRCDVPQLYCVGIYVLCACICLRVGVCSWQIEQPNRVSRHVLFTFDECCCEGEKIQRFALKYVSL